jgi:lipopolysaccharide export system permease protein
VKYLYPYQNPVNGHFVDYLSRQSNGEVVKTKSFEQLEFQDMHFNQQVLQSTVIDPDALSLLDLWFQKPANFIPLTEKESKLLTALYWKLTMPWLCLLAILAPIPFCTSFSRLLPVFLIYVCAVFGLIAFYLFMDAAQVVAKRQVLDPLWAIGFPFVSMFIFLNWRFIKNNN